MSGKEILIDTNIVLYLLDGSNTLEELLQGKNIYLSFITELELIGYKDITKAEEKQITSVLNDCSIVPITNPIKDKYVYLRRKYNLKLADAVIAATAIVLNVPFVSSDNHFKKIEELKLITYQHSIDPA